VHSQGKPIAPTPTSTAWPSARRDVRRRPGQRDQRGRTADRPRERHHHHRRRARGSRRPRRRRSAAQEPHHQRARRRSPPTTRPATRWRAGRCRTSTRSTR
jgi:hypothetical protein